MSSRFSISKKKLCSIELLKYRFSRRLLFSDLNFILWFWIFIVITYGLESFGSKDRLQYFSLHAAAASTCCSIACSHSFFPLVHLWLCYILMSVKNAALFVIVFNCLINYCFVCSVFALIHSFIHSFIFMWFFLISNRSSIFSLPRWKY